LPKCHWPTYPSKCDAISADRIELLARAVVLVAGMRIPEAAREAVLARVTAELANAAEQRPPTSARAGQSDISTHAEPVQHWC
jgi:hypothetical protein